jgi:hypothetical protein
MSCLFDSMYSLLSQHGIYFVSSHVLRTKITDFMRDNPRYSLESGTVAEWVKLTAEDMNTDSTSYISGMACASTWGGAMEMAVMSKIFNIQIDVIGRGGVKPLAQFNCTGGRAESKFTIHWSGSHYTPVSKVDM